MRFKVDDTDDVRDNIEGTPTSHTTSTLLLGGSNSGALDENKNDGNINEGVGDSLHSPFVSPVHLPPLPFSHESLTQHLHTAIDDLDNILAIDRWEWEFYDHFEKQFRMSNRKRNRTFTV